MAILTRSTFRATARTATSPVCSCALGEYEVPDAELKGGLCASWMFDFRPVLLSSRGSYVEVCEEEEEAFSPVHHIERIHSSVMSPVAMRRDRLQALVPRLCIRVRRGRAPRADRTGKHEPLRGGSTMTEKNGALARAVLGQMDLTA